jgi:hypothetical protein
MRLAPLQMTEKNQRPYFELRLGPDHINDLLDDQEGPSVISETTPQGWQFQLYYHPQHYATEFELSPDGLSYFAYIGDLSLRSPEDLVKLIAAKPELPIVMRTGDRRINLGTVLLTVEAGASSSRTQL